MRAGDTEVEVPADPDGQPLAMVFKTIADPFVGQVSLLKVLSGTIRNDDHLVNSRTGTDERLHGLFVVRGKEHEPVDALAAGDIGGVAKLAGTVTGDTLAPKGQPVHVDPIEQPPPVLATAVVAKTQADDDKLASALHRLQDEDPALVVDRDEETHQTVLRGTGETHLAITLERLERKFGVNLTTEDVQVRYRETISAPGLGRGQAQEAVGRPRPVRGGQHRGRAARAGRGLRVRRQDRRRRHQPRLHPGRRQGRRGDDGPRRRERLSGGRRARARSSTARSTASTAPRWRSGPPVASRSARRWPRPTRSCSSRSAASTSPCPSDLLGDVMGDLNSRRGKVQGTEQGDDGEQVIYALVPESELLRYAIDLRSLTGGRGRFAIAHDHYDVLPSHLVDKIRKDVHEAE